MSKQILNLKKRLVRMETMDGVDLCACNGLRCDGICRDNHNKGGEIVCHELFHIDLSGLRLKIDKMERQQARTEATNNNNTYI